MHFNVTIEQAQRIVVYQHLVCERLKNCLHHHLKTTAPNYTPASGQYAAAGLALVATAAVSCRSVASKTLTAATKVPELDLFLESSVPG